MIDLAEQLEIHDIYIHDLLYEWAFEATDKLPFILYIHNDEPGKLLLGEHLHIWGLGKIWCWDNGSKITGNE